MNDPKIPRMPRSFNAAFFGLLALLVFVCWLVLPAHAQTLAVDPATYAPAWPAGKYQVPFVFNKDTGALIVEGGTGGGGGSGGSTTFSSPQSVRLSDGTQWLAAATDRTTAAAPFAQRLTDGSAFYDARQIRALTSADVVTIAGTVPVSGTFWQATQPVSASTLPLPSGASTSAKQPALGTAGTPSSDVITVQGTTSMTPILVSGSSAVGSTPTLNPVSVSGVDGGGLKRHFLTETDGTLDAKVTSSALPTGAATAANQTTANTSLATIATNTNGSATAANQATAIASLATLAGKEGAARTMICYSATNAAVGTNGTETAVTLNLARGTASPTSAASFVPTSGKRFRIQNIIFGMKGNGTATAASCTFSLRLNTAGAVTTSSNTLISFRVGITAQANAFSTLTVPIEDGFDILGDGTLQIGVTVNAAYATNAPTVDVTLIGFDY